MEHISADVLKSMFSPKEIIEIVKDGILEYANGNYHIPNRSHIHRGASTNLIMPAFGKDYFCTKLISVDPENYKLNLPIISGILILNSDKTGETLVTMDAPMITALRTAAVGSIGLDLICTNTVKQLGIIGLGVQGYWQTLFACASKSITEVHCYSRNKSKFEAYKKALLDQFPTLQISWCPTPEEVVLRSQVIISCTTSISPVFDPKNLDTASKRFISVGSYAKEMQELPDEIYQQSDALIIDSAAAKVEVGDVIQTIKNNWIGSNNIFTLADILSQKVSISDHQNIVFKSVGMAAFDLALATAVYEKMK